MLITNLMAFFKEYFICKKKTEKRYFYLTKKFKKLKDKKH